MKVTGKLQAPDVPPCPGSNDIKNFVDSQCRPVRCPRKPITKGLDCCQTWDGPGQFATEVVRTDQVNPEMFDYDNYRYQLYAKPSRHESQGAGGTQPGFAPDKFYVAPTTDVRALKQTMYLPLLPTKPGGETEVTFPMTERTLGQPDVTTACCVPVMPCNPGFQNLTSCVLPDPRLKCQTYDKCKHPEQLASHRPDVCSRKAAHLEHQRQSGQKNCDARGPPPHRPLEFVVPPSNQQSNAFFGAPDVFPQPDKRYPVPEPHHFQVPHYDGSFPAGYQTARCTNNNCNNNSNSNNNCDDEYSHDGFYRFHGPAQVTTSLKAFKYPERVASDFEEYRETEEQRIRRLREPFGAFGSALQMKQCHKRHVQGPRESLTLQGNGFTWAYPKYHNRLCYVVQRNYRC